MPGPIEAPGRTRGAEGAAVQRLRRVAQQFEAVFLRELLKQSEDPFGGGGLSGTDVDPAMRQYRAMRNDVLAERASGGTGVAELIVRAMAEHVEGR